MSFRIMARTILELGAELISSDGIALYELIKNSMDAGARTVRIDVQAPILASQYDELFAAVRGVELERDTFSETLEAALLRPKLISLGADLVSDLRSRVEAAADGSMLDAVRAWYLHHNWIRVTDAGHGMSMADLDAVYLTIGTRSRRQERSLLGPDERPPLGEKGVGRLSTMRLGDQLEVRTTRAGNTHDNLLEVDWSLFSHDSDALLSEVLVEPRVGPLKSDPEVHGTTVTIRGLRSDWSLAKVQSIADQEFSKLVDPFGDSSSNNILRLFFGAERVIMNEVDHRILDLAHGHLKATYVVSDDRPSLTGSAEYALRDKQRTFSLNATDLMSVVRISAPNLLQSLGSFDLEMWWFNRRLIHAVDELGTRKEITDEVARWSGGLMLFRDGYRVLPYGGPDDDWLQLDKKAFASKGFKLNRQQVVGRVRISWKNQGLHDQTNREGLTDTPEKRVFVALLQHLLLTEFKAWLDREDKAARIQERTTLENIGEKIEATETDVKGRLRQIERALPEEDRHLVRTALGLLKELTGYLNEARALSEEVANDRAQLVHLAGIGLMVEFIMHELARTTEATLSTLRDIDRSALQRGTSAAITVLGDQLLTLSKRVANLDPLSAARRQTKEQFDVGDVVRQVVEGRSGQINRHRVALRGNFADAPPWRIKAVRGMFIQILENLLSNSFYWMRRQADLVDDFQPVLTIEIDPTERFVSITDNGPGVSFETASEIFQPFVTRKPAGEGHGLGLYISREIAAYHGWGLDIERTPTVHPDRYNTFVLDMSA